MAGDIPEIEGVGWIRRRRVVTLLRRAIMLSVAWPLHAMASEPKRIAVMTTVVRPAPNRQSSDSLVRASLAALGYVDGKDVVVSMHRPSSGQRFDDLAEAVVRTGPAVIVISASVGAATLRRFTSTIPIVLAGSVDPIAAGLAESFARPGRNVTGLTLLADGATRKAVELIRDVLPDRRVVLGLTGRGSTPAYAQLDEAFFEATAHLGLSASRVELLGDSDEDRIREAIAKYRPSALFAAIHPAVVGQIALINDIARTSHTPWFTVDSSYAQLGALATYGPNADSIWKRSADFVDRILKGGNPATMPIEQPTHFERVINLRAARALGIQVPTNVLAVADEIIE